MFAASKGGAARTATQQVFTSSGTWVAPSTVSKVAVLTGTGGTGQAAQWNSLFGSTIYGISRDSSVGSGTLSWGSLYSTALSTISDLNSGGPGDRIAPNSVTNEFYFVTPDDSVIDGSNNTGYLDGELIRGTASLVSVNVQTSGQVLYSQLNSGISGWSLGGSLEVFQDATTGGSTTALGYTFLGGTGGPATPVTYTNVPVTPGASYFISIVAGEGGSVSLTYLV